MRGGRRTGIRGRREGGGVGQKVIIFIVIGYEKGIIERDFKLGPPPAVTRRGEKRGGGWLIVVRGYLYNFYAKKNN